MENEQIIIGIIVNGGNGKSRSMEAIQHARNGKFEEAEISLNEADKEIHKAHQIQTQLIQEETGGEKHEISLLMVHAQDHLMNAMTVRDLAEEMIKMQIQIQK